MDIGIADTILFRIRGRGSRRKLQSSGLEKIIRDFPTWNGHNGAESDFADITFDDLKARNANFFRAIIQGVRFPQAKLAEARFSESTISDSSFAHANLELARFDGATIQRTDFNYSRLWRSIFDEAKLENVKFTGADIRSASFRGISLENDKIDFTDAPWWLAIGWTLDDLSLLAERYPTSGFKNSETFKTERGRLLKRIDEWRTPAERVQNLNDFAWMVATSDADLAEGQKRAEEAIKILTGSDVKDDYKLASVRDTLGYILLQMGKAQPAKTEFEQSLALDKTSRETKFRLAVTLYVLPEKDKAFELLRESIADGYQPTHELYLLKNIGKEFFDKYRASISKTIGK